MTGAGIVAENANLRQKATALTSNELSVEILDDYYSPGLNLMKWNLWAAGLLAAGTLLSLYVDVFKTGGDSHSMFADILVVGPWIVLIVLYASLRKAAGFAIAAALMLTCEIWFYFGVFVIPRSSTDGLVYFFKPALQLLILTPFGLGVGYLIEKRSSP